MLTFLRLSLVLGFMLVSGACSTVSPAAISRYQGYWEVGVAWEEFVTLDGEHPYYIEMPSSYDHYFLRKNLPTFRDSQDGDFKAVYVDVSGYLAPTRQDLVHETLHVVQVYEVSRARKSFLETHHRLVYP